MKRFILASCIILLSPQLVALPQFPVARPPDAAYQHITKDGDEYDAYFWWENENLWMEADPTTADPFICDIYFDIVQNGKQYNVDIKDSSNTGFCSHLYIDSIFRIVQSPSGSPFNAYADAKIFAQASAGKPPFIIELPAAQPTPSPTPSPTPAPTLEPTPTPLPSVVPTPLPTGTPAPTPEPSQCPAPEPTGTPLPSPTSTPAPIYDKPQADIYDIDIKKATCKRKNGPAFPATQLPGPGNFVCDGKLFKPGDKVTITITGTKK